MANLDVLHLYLSAEKIQAVVGTLADRISKDYSALLKPNEEMLMIVILKGAIFFAADLARKLTIPVHIDFVRLSSYGGGTQSSGSVRIIKDVEEIPQDKHVLVVEDILDTGHTLSFLLTRLRSAETKSLKICTLLNKPSRRQVTLNADYVGLDVENKFLVGYGLDFNEKYRNLKDIYSIESGEKP